MTYMKELKVYQKLCSFLNKILENFGICTLYRGSFLHYVPRVKLHNKMQKKS